MMPKVKSYDIVLADDHELFRQDLRKIIDGMSGLKVVGEACNGHELLKLIGSLRPQMAILDISMPKLSGIDAAHEIEQKHPRIKVLILTIHKDDAYLRRAISVGAEGYVLKEHIDRDLYPAISVIRQGQVFFPSLI
ncbi:MAG: response regulator transcription factor [Nitrospirae bacterium]|nr:response regulator transcription factor [Nitrospirota bacterium]